MEGLLDYQRKVQEFQRPKTPIGEVHTVDPVTKLSMNIPIRVPELKMFNGKKPNAKSWLKKIKKYFIAAGLLEQDNMHNAQMNAIVQALMWGRASKWLDCLE